MARRVWLSCSPSLAEIFAAVDAELRELFPRLERGMGHLRAREKKALLKQRGVNWLTPMELNRRVRFD